MDRKIPDVRVGQRISAEEQNGFRRKAISDIRVIAPLQVSIVGNTAFLVLNRDQILGGAGSGVAQFRVVAEQDDYLNCTRFNPADPNTPGASTNVAKPWLLRRTPFDGETIAFPDGDEITYTYITDSQRTATNQEDYSEVEDINCPYFVDAIITANRILTDVNVGGTLLVWQDDGQGRYWMHEVQDEG